MGNQKIFDMESIVLKPKDRDEMNFFLELARRMGIPAFTFDAYQDELLLDAMEENRKTPKTDREKVLNTINQILNESPAPYSKNED